MTTATVYNPTVAVVLAPTPTKLVLGGQQVAAIKAGQPGAVVTAPTPAKAVVTNTQAVVQQQTGIQGRQGDKGDTGTGANTTFTWQQDVPSALWTIPHNLNRHPSVTVVDTAGETCFGAVDYVDANHLTIEFSAGFGGIAYLN